MPWPVSYSPCKDADTKGLGNNLVHSGRVGTKVCENPVFTKSASFWNCRAKQKILVNAHLKTQTVVLGPNTGIRCNVSCILTFTTETRMKEKLKTDWLEHKEIERREESVPFPKLLEKRKMCTEVERLYRKREPSLFQSTELHSRSPFLNIHLILGKSSESTGKSCISYSFSD